LKLEKDKLQTLIDGLAGTEIGIDIVNTDYRVLFQNRILRERFGDLTGELCYEKYMGQKEPCDFCPMQKAIAASHAQRAEVLGVDGRYYELLAAPLPDPDGTVDKAIEVVKDITDRKRAEEGLHRELKEKEVLLKEIHHRVKNNLQVISSLLSLQSHHVQGERDRELFRESQDRVRSMALVHEKLYQSNSFAHIDFADYVKSLIHGLRRTYCINPGAIKIDVTADNVKLNIDLAVPCGLIINELVSNAIKHAFPISRKKEGRIQITLRHLEKRRIELIVQDNGTGMPEGLDFNKTESLGLKLVSILVKDQLDGTIRLDRKRGTKFRIVFQGSV
jgi:two-component sensor histidine kinase